MGLNWAEHSEEIDAPVETCFDAIVDYESFPRWQDAVDSVEVLARTPDGLMCTSRETYLKELGAASIAMDSLSNGRPTVVIGSKQISSTCHVRKS